jgi:hypothetical protein
MNDDLAGATHYGGASPRAPLVKSALAPRNSASGLRTWTDLSGRYQVEARFLSFDGTTVRLQREDGRRTVIDVKDLSEGDAALVRQAQGRGIASR